MNRFTAEHLVATREADGVLALPSRSAIDLVLLSVGVRSPRPGVASAQELDVASVFHQMPDNCG